ncbi:hypothetical protein FS749_009148 [Ceratobasidium sp. UAMH 11750]|nr:hypothetical protein FS749_009148 [Ceratobasidium sp. UAMH 11750]
MHILLGSCLCQSPSHFAITKNTKIERDTDWDFCSFEHFKDLEGVDLAIDSFKKAVALTPDGHPNKFALLNNLFTAYDARFDHTNNLADWQSLIACLKMITQTSTGLPSPRFTAARMWAMLCAMDPTMGSPLAAYKELMALIPQVVWLGSGTDRQYESVASIENIATDAATIAIEHQKYELALEWLEEGRAVVWNQLLQLCTPLDQLATVNPSLAQEMSKVFQALDLATPSDSPPESPLDFSAVQEPAQRRRRLAEKRDDLVAQARSLPGMRDFLRPKSASSLAAAARIGPVVMVIAEHRGCYALIVQPRSTQVTCLPLINFKYKKAIIARALLSHSLLAQGRSDRAVTNRPQSTKPMEDVLRMLWADVAKPVLDFFGYKRSTRRSEKLPPTSILAVGQDNTPGFSPLPGTAKELENISVQTGNLRLTRLEGYSATTSAELAALDDHSWVHLACHGSQSSTKPTASAFHLHDGPLDLVTIIQKQLKHADLAFLSACQTAKGDEHLPEEAVHLAAGMIMAGYRRVIATMWSINDEDAPLVAEKFYAYMLDGQHSNEGKAAKALHYAVGCLRDKVGTKEFGRWAPYIHIGQ